MDDLSETHWNDVMSPSTTLSASQNYTDILHENGFQDDDDDNSTHSDGFASPRHDDPFNNPVYQHSPEPEEPEQQQEQQYDKEALETENKQILSALTKNDENDEKDVVLSKDDNLFNNIDVGPVVATNTTTTTDQVSPVKKRTTKIMYKPPRFRRSGINKQESKQTESKHDGPDDHDPLGLMGLNGDDEDTNGVNNNNDLGSPLRRDKLVNSIDKPLFELSGSSSSSSPKKLAQQQQQQQKQAQAVEAAAGATPAFGPGPEAVPASVPAEYQFDIIVGDPHKIGNELINAHIEYSVITKSTFPVFDKVDEIVVSRRYNDFLWLYSQLVYNHQGIVIPPPPEKQAVGRFNKNFIENRRMSLEKMLLKIGEHSVLQKDQDFIIFLTSENFTNESRYREHSAENVLEQQQLQEDAETGSSSAFSMSSFFSSAPKYVEQDMYWVDQQQYIENLSMNLKNLYKSFELITNTRTELVISIEELNKHLGKLAELEINNELAVIFTNYNDLISKIQDNIERLSMSEMLTIGNTVDEYIRTIGSVKLIFTQRNKINLGILTNEANLAKKQKNLSKLKLKFHNQLDKIKKAELEITDLNKIIDHDKIKRDELVEIIKAELIKFDHARLADFKNAFEIYWENLIESQKELIELWETFYDTCKF